MPAHSSVASHTDAIYSISPTLPATYDVVGYEAIVNYAIIGEVSDFPNYGAKRNVNEFVPIRGPVKYLKGSARYGSGDLMMADIPADPGQVVLAAAEESPNHYSLKILYPDGEAHYCDVIVSGSELSQAKEGAAMIRTATVSFCRKPVIDAAA